MSKPYVHIKCQGLKENPPRIYNFVDKLCNLVNTLRGIHLISDPEFTVTPSSPQDLISLNIKYKETKGQVEYTKRIAAMNYFGACCASIGLSQSQTIDLAKKIKNGDVKAIRFFIERAIRLKK